MNPFSLRCYNLLRKVPRGKITNYKDLAHAMKNKTYRAVGTALNKNPYAPQVPCHRVINSDGRIGGFAAGTKKKIEILKKEGIPIKQGKVEHFEKYLYKF